MCIAIMWSVMGKVEVIYLEVCFTAPALFVIY